MERRISIPLQWRHNERDSVSNHHPHDCLFNCLFRRRRSSKKTSKLRVTGLCAGNSPVTGEFPVQRASNAENVSIWWRHHVCIYSEKQVDNFICSTQYTKIEHVTLVAIIETIILTFKSSTSKIGHPKIYQIFRWMVAWGHCSRADSRSGHRTGLISAVSLWMACIWIPTIWKLEITWNTSLGPGNCQQPQLPTANMADADLDTKLHSLSMHLLSTHCWC